MMNIDDISSIDKSDMYGLIKRFVDQLDEGKKIAEEAELRYDPRDLHHIVVAGMGGSAIAGDLVRCFSINESRLPIAVIRNYRLPAYVNENSLVIISSFSGNTEETLSAFKEALERKAFIICISSGGIVEEMARANDFPLIKIPGGMPPRAALGFSLSVLLVVAHRLGIIALSESAWAETIQVLRNKSELYSDPSKSHDAIEIASQLVNRFPFIYSASGILEAVNLRWRGQIQENSKKLVAGNVYPELNHNEIMGWDSASGSALYNSVGVVVLRDQDDHVRIQHRMDVTRGLLQERAGYWIELETSGIHNLTRMMSLINLGDWVSFYLACLRRVDPTPIGMIDKLKQELAKL